MKVTTPEISWHERDPIYTVDIQPGQHKIRRLVSGGVDKYVRVGAYFVSHSEFLACMFKNTGSYCCHTASHF